MSLNRTQIVDWLYRCGDIFTKQSDFLTGLDKEIGDADHGLNMHRGFSKVVEKLPSIADKDIGFIDFYVLKTQFLCSPPDEHIMFVILFDGDNLPGTTGSKFITDTAGT